MINEVYVIFKTHLDVGFTNFAADVIDAYCRVFIPGVFELKHPNFVWTTGSWLIDEYLKRAGGKERAQIEKAIMDGRISWHGLPFTTHTEFMSEKLFEHGIGISRRLDARFGRRTISAKMTDVPGHTRGMVPIMARNGIEFLHLGKNPSSTAPDVPGLFRWRDPDGSELIVMYDKEYGACAEIPGTGKAVYFAHTGDNAGPPDDEDLDELYAELAAQFPGAALTAADLNTIAKAASGIKASLPVVTSEIGDTWIHGVGSDPRKCSGYRRLLRLAETLKPQSREKVLSGLLTIPEHTWGLDEKTHLNDVTNFTKESFIAARGGKAFLRMEKSWQEQRDYLTAAISGLEGRDLRLARAALDEYRINRPSVDGLKKIANPHEDVEIPVPVPASGNAAAVGGGEKAVIRVDRTGAVCYLKWNGAVLSDPSHLWCNPVYEAFGPEDYRRFLEQYLVITPDWALRDNAKMGMESAIGGHLAAAPGLEGLYIGIGRAVILMSMGGDANALYGAPSELATVIDFYPDRIEVDFAWFGKPATRVAEAMWLGFNLIPGGLELHKLGEWIDPLDVARHGNRSLHAVELGVRAGGLTIRSEDAALVAPGLPSLLDFNDGQPDLAKGVYFNLHNNVWGTNFRMWYEEDARFKFIVTK